jgi:hypothetical protein
MIFSDRDKVNATTGGLLLILSGGFYLFFFEIIFSALHFGLLWFNHSPEMVLADSFYTRYQTFFGVTAFLFFTELGTYKSITTKYLFQWSVPLFGVIQEMGQYFGFVNGTFDIFDLLSYLVVPILYQTLKILTHEK